MLEARAKGLYCILPPATVILLATEIEKINKYFYMKKKENKCHSCLLV